MVLVKQGLFRIETFKYNVTSLTRENEKLLICCLYVAYKENKCDSNLCSHSRKTKRMKRKDLQTSPLAAATLSYRNHRLHSYFMWVCFIVISHVNKNAFSLGNLHLY